jgi:hypothetical protein
MVLWAFWWSAMFAGNPYSVWFYDHRHYGGGSNPVYTGPEPVSEWPSGMYWFYKIPASGGHNDQLAYKSPEDRYCRWYDSNHVMQPGYRKIVANTLYIITMPGDTPNWVGSPSFVEIGAPCGNWNSDEWEFSWTTRNQTIVTSAAVRATQENPFTISSVVAVTKDAACPIDAAVQGVRDLDVSEWAAIQGNVDKPAPIRAAVRKELTSNTPIISAIAKDFDTPAKIISYIQGNPLIWYRHTAFVRGETEIPCGISALVVVDRTPKILIDIENLGPQERDVRSTPNWASRAIDWTKTSLEHEYGDL